MLRPDPFVLSRNWDIPITADDEFILGQHQKFSRPPTVWEIPIDNSAEIDIEDIRETFSNYSLSEIAIVGDRAIVSANPRTSVIKLEKK